MSIAAELSGVCDEADRAMRHLQLGDWRAITFESQQAVVSMARANQEALVVVAATSAVQLGLLKRVLEKAQRTAADWLAEAI
jgi:predicted regulator of Ras-like GTPase activity (Roadblock/LC7/MglB family)